MDRLSGYWTLDYKRSGGFDWPSLPYIETNQAAIRTNRGRSRPRLFFFLICNVFIDRSLRVALRRWHRVCTTVDRDVESKSPQPRSEGDTGNMKGNGKKQRKRPAIKLEDLIPRDGNLVRGGKAPRQVFGTQPLPGQLGPQRKRRTD